MHKPWAFAAHGLIYPRGARSWYNESKNQTTSPGQDGSVATPGNSPVASTGDDAAAAEGDLERNPLLERAESEAPVSESAPEPQAGGDAKAADWAGDELETSRTAIEERLGTELENVFDDDGAGKTAVPEA